MVSKLIPQKKAQFVKEKSRKESSALSMEIIINEWIHNYWEVYSRYRHPHTLKVVEHNLFVIYRSEDTSILLKFTYNKLGSIRKTVDLPASGLSTLRVVSWIVDYRMPVKWKKCVLFNSYN